MNIINWPQHSNLEISKIKNVLKSGKTNYLFGKEGELFEKEFAKFTNTKHAVALSNGTVALDIAIKSLKLKKNSEIIVTPKSFIASASCILLNDLKPKFIDVDIDSHNISIERIEKNISKRTSAIICVHLGGQPCNMLKINTIAKKHKLYVIEDCSQAHGAKINNQSVGSFGDVSTWSFCYDKIISTGGEGGMITTNNKKIYNFCWSYKDHGKNKKKFNLAKKNNDGKFKYLHDNLGSNFRMLEIQSAMGRVQLQQLKKNIKKRTKFTLFIKDSFKNSRLYSFQNSNFNYKNSFYRLYINLNKKYLKNRTNNINFISFLLKKDIQCGVGSSSEIYKEKCFKEININLKNFKNTKHLSKYSFAIFINHYLDLIYAKKIIKNLKFLENEYSK